MNDVEVNALDAGAPDTGAQNADVPDVPDVPNPDSPIVGDPLDAPPTLVPVDTEDASHTIPAPTDTALATGGDTAGLIPPATDTTPAFRHTVQPVGQNEFRIHDGDSLIGHTLSPTEAPTVLRWLRSVYEEFAAKL